MGITRSAVLFLCLLSSSSLASRGHRHAGIDRSMSISHQCSRNHAGGIGLRFLRRDEETGGVSTSTYCVQTRPVPRLMLRAFEGDRTGDSMDGEFQTLRMAFASVIEYTESGDEPGYQENSTDILVQESSLADNVTWSDPSDTTGTLDADTTLKTITATTSTGGTFIFNLYGASEEYFIPGDNTSRSYSPEEVHFSVEFGVDLFNNPVTNGNYIAFKTYVIQTSGNASFTARDAQTSDDSTPQLSMDDPDQVNSAYLAWADDAVIIDSTGDTKHEVDVISVFTADVVPEFGQRRGVADPDNSDRDMPNLVVYTFNRAIDSDYHTVFWDPEVGVDYEDEDDDDAAAGLRASIFTLAVCLAAVLLH